MFLICIFNTSTQRAGNNRPAPLPPFPHIYQDNTIQDILGFDHAQRKTGPKRYDPVLPQCYSYTVSIILNFDGVDVKDLPPIRYELFADHSEAKIDILGWEGIEWVNEDGGTKMIDLSKPII